MNRPIACPTLVGRKKGWNFDGYCYCDNVECFVSHVLKGASRITPSAVYLETLLGLCARHVHTITS